MFIGEENDSDSFSARPIMMLNDNIKNFKSFVENQNGIEESYSRPQKQP